MKRTRKKIVIQARYIGTPLAYGNIDKDWFTWHKYADLKDAQKALDHFATSWKLYEFRIKPGENKMSRPKTVPLFVLDAVNEFWKEKHYAPSIRDIMEKTGIKSESGIHTHLATLRELGYVKYDDNIARSVRSVEYDLVISTLLNGKAVDEYTVRLESRLLTAQVG